MNPVLTADDKRQELMDVRHENVRLNKTVRYLRNEVSRLATALTTVEVLKLSLMTPKVILIDYEKDLTPRETEVLLRIMSGDSTLTMARRFFISESTVKAFIQSIYKKLDVHNRGGATAAGFHLGLDPSSTEDSELTLIERKTP